MDVPAGVTQEEGHTGFLHFSSAVLSLIFIAKMIQPFLSLVDREVEFCVPTNQSFSTSWAFFFFFFVRKNLSSCDCIEIRTHVSTSECVSRLPTEPPGDRSVSESGYDTA